MTHEERARALNEAIVELSADYGPFDAMIGEKIAAALADVERETFRTVYKYLHDYHMTKVTTTAKPAMKILTDLEDWCRAQAKGEKK